MQDTSKEYYEIENVKTQETHKVEKKFLIYDIFNIDPYQFTQLYYGKIAPALSYVKDINENEQSGVNLTRGVCWALILAFSYFDILLWVATFTEKQVSNRRAAFVFALVFMIPLIFVPLMFFQVRKVDRYALKERFFSFFNVNYSRYTYVERFGNKAIMYSKPPSEKITKAMEKMAISSLKYTLDEGLEIAYKGKVLEFLELNTRFSSGSFLIVSYFINKNFKGETIIKSVKEGTKSSFSSKQKVLLEDPVFNENFTIFSDDQIEARYLLTTGFMERLLIFQRDHNCTVSVLFDNSISPNSNVFLSLSFGKDFFEIPHGTRWIQNPAHFYNICKEIKEITQILDALKEDLKLDQDIGM